MTYSYTQISQYLACPRRYRYRYLDGWREKETRAAMLFGRAFEKALAAYFRREDFRRVFKKEWRNHRKSPLTYSNGDTWERMSEQGLELLEQFSQEKRIRVRQPRKNIQVEITKPLGNGTDFLSYIDAIGAFDGTRCLIEWKTTTSRYPAEPEGLLALDPQLICYAWMSGITDVALVAFLRKKTPEIQYLRTSISPEQCHEYGRLVEETIRQIEAGQFLPHSGIRFPQNGCVSCPYLGMCLNDQDLINAKLIRRPGAEDFDWLDQIEY